MNDDADTPPSIRRPIPIPVPIRTLSRSGVRASQENKTTTTTKRPKKQANTSQPASSSDAMQPPSSTLLEQTTPPTQTGTTTNANDANDTQHPKSTKVFWFSFPDQILLNHKTLVVKWNGRDDE
jgi:hypothetical protein